MSKIETRTPPLLTWHHGTETFTRPWLSSAPLSPPKTVRVADDAFKADAFYRLASEGAAFVWTGDFQNAKQLLQAVQRRIEKAAEKSAAVKGSLPAASPSPAETREAFHRHRQKQAHRAQLLARLLIPIDSNGSIPLSRAPDARDSIRDALGETHGNILVSLKEILAFIGAHEWKKKGVIISALGAKVHPHYGVFSPVRGEYLDLIAEAPLPSPTRLAFDIGTGTGVIAALLAKRGVEKIIATDLDDRALACARANIQSLGYAQNVVVTQTDLFPSGEADLIVCNPPWVPAKPTSSIENAVYDLDSQMLKGFLKEVRHHLSAHGEAWLILSDLAEHLGLRAPTELQELFAASGLQVVGSLEAKPRHGKAFDAADPLYSARSRETTRLWRLRAQN